MKSMINNELLKNRPHKWQENFEDHRSTNQNLSHYAIHRHLNLITCHTFIDCYVKKRNRKAGKSATILGYAHVDFLPFPFWGN